MQTAINNKTFIKVKVKQLIADMVTPVSLYLKIRDQYSNALLLESSDYHSKENSRSFICFDPLASVVVNQFEGKMSILNETVDTFQIENKRTLQGKFQAFLQSFESDAPEDIKAFNGFFGYSTFDAVQYFESVRFDEDKHKMNIPDLQYSFYRFVIMINHFTNDLYIVENIMNDEPSKMEAIEEIIHTQNFASFGFKSKGEETSNCTDEDFLNMVRKGKEHCQRGDVFQIVLSRQYQQPFTGDDFTVYRALRKINPSPYLFYFDYGSFRIFGSSPEAQLTIENKKAKIYPIAGTYRRTGNDEIDRQEALKLAADPKENAEHVMLVDLARNDLSRNTSNVEVSNYKEIQFFSHVIHLVSTVEGDLDSNHQSVAVFGDTFPAGTLSGAPKFKALQLINQYENQNRSFYGGAIGFFNLSGDLNQAIMIRSFLSQNNSLYYQAGAGIVIQSDEQKELLEVGNKLRALRKALELAEKL